MLSRPPPAKLNQDAMWNGVQECRSAGVGDAYWHSAPSSLMSSMTVSSAAVGLVCDEALFWSVALYGPRHVRHPCL